MTEKRIKLAVLAPLMVGLVTLTALVIFATFVLWIGTTSSQRMVVESGETTLTTAADLITRYFYEGNTEEMSNILNTLVQNENIIRMEVRSTTGSIILSGTSDESWRPERENSRALAVQALAEEGPVYLDMGDYLMMTTPMGQGGTLEIVFDQAPHQELMRSNRRMIIIVGPTIVLLTMGILALVARRIASPLKALSNAAHQIGKGNLDVEIPVFGTQEIAQLGYALRTTSNNLKDFYRNFEQQVAALERRTQYLETTAEIARQAALALDSQKLLPQVVDLISQRLDFYHTGIFLIDTSGEWALLQAASSSGGKRMLAREHKLRIGQQGIVGFVTGHGQHRIALDVGEDAVYFDNPDLPETRSEMALPLRVRGTIIGALDVQSKEPGAFSDEDVAVLQTLADQVAMAISNARLFQQTQESLKTIRQAYGELSQQAWIEILKGRTNIGYYCDTQGVQPIRDRRELPRQAEDDQPTLSIPIKVRDQRIGTISAHKPTDAGEWTSEEIELMKALVDQLDVALESARLYQDAQGLAARERLISDVTTHVRETLDIETMLKTAVQDVRQALNLPEVTIRLGVSSHSPRFNGDGSGNGEEVLA